MRERVVDVCLSTPGTTPVHVQGCFHEFTPADRVKRSAIVMGVALLLAGTLIPIPIIHLLGIPILVLTGIVLAVKQLSCIGRLSPLRVKCPKCGEPNRVGGGLGYRTTGPMERMCDSCRRGLTLLIEPVDDAPVVGTESRSS